ncbi:hypothetical protein HYH03_004335 [Edaphochlamys debaryana]|uniref:C-CAP/cofactor C-like domain-containing protein n=1 Tax=Edaphochlamys debaryana TaxID=47281 RepID=A0A836C3E2_9CHLO|nr:hypothetical protein HYH03_004335 [Edaphochlamys debaryana]|eukprot:KAG2497589.1 hypothetical protein HYH03_004335 [Edaphochlamys debaryana]
MASDPEVSTGAGPAAPALPPAASEADPAAPASASGDGADASTSTGSMSTAAAVVLDKLATLDVARKAERERRREETRAAADPRESVAAFLSAFAARQRNVEEAIQRLLQQHQAQLAGAQTQAAPPPAVVAAAPQPSTNGPDASRPLPVNAASPEAVNASLELVSAEVLSMEQSAAGASYYLPPYDQKQCAAAVAAMRAAIESARATVVPRKRFAFGSKKVAKVSGLDLSAAAAAAAPATTATASPATQDPFATPTTSTSTASAPAATAAAAAEDDDAPAALSVSEQDRALVARGRGLMGLTGATVVLRAADLESGADTGTGTSGTGAAGAAGGAGGGGVGDFVLLGLTRCTVVVVGRLRALRMAGLRGCRVVAGPVTGGCFLDDVRGCSLALAAYQVRVHRAHASTLFLRVRSNPIVEHCDGIRVAPWGAGVAQEPRLQALLAAHKLGEENGSWQKVDDFGWIKAQQSPHWALLPEAEWPQPPMEVPQAVWERPPSERGAEAEAAGRQQAAAGADVDEI